MIGKRTLFVGLMAVASMGSAGCKHHVKPVTIQRTPRIAGPTAQAIEDEKMAKLAVDLEVLPDLGAGVNYTTPDGEIWARYPSGLMIHDLKPSNEIVPKLGQTVSIAYTGTFPADKKVFDKRGASSPLSFMLGTRQIVKGMNMGISTMHLSGKRRIFVPPDLAYGEKGNPSRDIGPDQALIFEVELLSITGEVVELPPPALPLATPAGPTLEELLGPATGTAPATK